MGLYCNSSGICGPSYQSVQEPRRKFRNGVCSCPNCSEPEGYADLFISATRCPVLRCRRPDAGALCATTDNALSVLAQLQAPMHISNTPPPPHYPYLTPRLSTLTVPQLGPFPLANKLKLSRRQYYSARPLMFSENLAVTYQFEL